MALKNLGAIFGKEGDSLKALYYLRHSNECDPLDPQTVYGPAFAYMELGAIELVQKHCQMVLEMEAPEDLRGLARNGLQKIAVRGLKARWQRMDAVFYLARRCGCSAGSRWRRSQEIAFEIGCCEAIWASYLNWLISTLHLN